MIFRKTFLSLSTAFLLLSSSHGFAIDDATSDPFFKKYSREERKFARKSFKQLVDQINATYGLNLTPKEMCTLLKENMDQLDIPHSVNNSRLKAKAFS